MRNERQWGIIHVNMQLPKNCLATVLVRVLLAMQGK